MIQIKPFRDHLFCGTFGLEKEGLRVDANGRFAHTPHPFSDSDGIGRDFSESQTEINTGVCSTAEEVMEELSEKTTMIHRRLDALPEKEYLWPFSNPPYIRNELDIPIARFYGDEAYKTAYREYLSDRYGRYKMAFSGIHVNYAFDEQLLREVYEQFKKERCTFSAENAQGLSCNIGVPDAGMGYRAFKDAFYLKLAAQCAAYGWIVTALTAASPVMDGSYMEKHAAGKDLFLGLASVRSSELGYWNFFAPVFDYSSLEAYVNGIRKYVNDGLIRNPSELYYPVRLKPRGDNSLSALQHEGVDHIELRMVDLNPLLYEGLDIRDVKFIQLFLVWLAFTPAKRFEIKDQVQAVQNFKNAAHYDLKTVKIVPSGGLAESVADASLEIIRRMQAFYEGFEKEVSEILAFEEDKLINPENRYAWQIYREYREGYFEKGLQLAKKRQAQGQERSSSSGS